jgi:hypothetical protein
MPAQSASHSPAGKSSDACVTGSWTVSSSPVVKAMNERKFDEVFNRIYRGNHQVVLPPPRTQCPTPPVPHNSNAGPTTPHHRPAHRHSSSSASLTPATPQSNTANSSDRSTPAQAALNPRTPVGPASPPSPASLTQVTDICVRINFDEVFNRVYRKHSPLLNRARHSPP